MQSTRLRNMRVATRGGAGGGITKSMFDPSPAFGLIDPGVEYPQVSASWPRGGWRENSVPDIAWMNRTRDVPPYPDARTRMRSSPVYGATVPAGQIDTRDGTPFYMISASDAERTNRTILYQRIAIGVLGAAVVGLGALAVKKKLWRK